jgi:hypothetical protein
MSLPHESLVAWQRADDLFVDVHQLTHQRFPAFERNELGSHYAGRPILFLQTGGADGAA